MRERRLAARASLGAAAHRGPRPRSLLLRSRAATPSSAPPTRSSTHSRSTLCRRAYRRGMPILGICRGAQVLNVARQGTLHQHVPDLIDGSVEHRQPEPRRSHDPRGARVAGQRPRADHRRRPGQGQLVSPSGDRPPGPRSAPGRVGRGRPDRGRRGERAGRFALGVQWHAETLVGEAEQLALFERLVEAAAPAGRSRRTPVRDSQDSDSGEQEDSGAHAV